MSATSAGLTCSPACPFRSSKSWAGFLSSKLLAPPAPKEAPLETAVPTAPKARIAELKQMIEAQERATADLRTKLDEIDALL